MVVSEAFDFHDVRVPLRSEIILSTPAHTIGRSGSNSFGSHLRLGLQRNRSSGGIQR
jgi:hypothetical protein